MDAPMAGHPLTTPFLHQLLLKIFTRRGFALVLLAVATLGLAVPSMFLGSATRVEAASQTTTLKHLGVEDVIHLPTVSSQREIEFQLPQSWQVTGGKLDMQLQHSSELIRSKMDVILNDRIMKTIPLTKANAELTQVMVPLSGLKQTNVLKFRVVQHYTDKCEDPVDASLWTNVLNDSALSFTYAPKRVSLGLQAFPKPLVETGTAYSIAHEAQLAVIVPQQPDKDTLQAISLVQAYLGMHARNQELLSTAVSEAPTQGNVLWIGLPATMPSRIQELAGNISAAKLQNGQWIHANGQTLSDKEALVAVLPRSDGAAAVIVSANTPAGLVNGAEFLTNHYAVEKYLQNNGGATNKTADKTPSMVVPASWQASAPPTPAPRYIATEARTFKQLGFGDQFVEKLYAPPIVFNVPVVTNVDQGQGTGLTLDVMYSYSAGLNPRYSSLEWRMNDRSIANIPLTNAGGQERLRATIAVPAELVKPHNTLVAQFHLMPDKYGFCKDDFVDNAWGKLFADESSIRVNGTPATRLPSAGLLNSTGYPFTTPYDMANSHLVFAPKQTSLNAWNAWLALVGRLGRMSDAPAGYEFSTSLNANDLPSGKHVLVLGDTTTSGSYNALPIRHGVEGKAISLIETGDQGVATLALADVEGVELQQAGHTGNITLLAAGTDEAYTTLAELFNRDEAFQQLTAAQVVQGGKTQLNAIRGFSLHGVTLAEGETVAAQGQSGFGSYHAPQRDYGWLNVILLPLQTAMDWLRLAIVWFVNLPILSTLIHWLLWPWTLLFALPLIGGWIAAAWAWFQAHIILGFMMGTVLFCISLAIVLAIIGLIVRLATRR